MAFNSGNRRRITRRKVEKDLCGRCRALPVARVDRIAAELGICTVCLAQQQGSKRKVG